ncbi:MAG: glycoside hydrolase family 17 protein, partial [Methylovulum sp.]
GVKMIQGAWLGGIDRSNNKEIQELIRAANAYPDVIKRVIVGNEVLLRGDLDSEQLINYIRTVKKAVKQPVSYADVWSMYMKHPELIKEVDFVTIHILPYWEDEPIAVEQAPAHIERIYKHVREEADAIAPGKAILIGESGWPSQGRQRGWSVPGVVNEAKFIRGLIKVANENGFDVNIVEAINQSWKSALEGVVGANWGLFSADRKEVFPLTGQVQENPGWYKELIASTIIVLMIFSYGWSRLKTLPSLHLVAFLLFLQVLSTLLVSQTSQLWCTSYTEWQRLLTIVVIGFNVAFGGFALQRAYDLLACRNGSVNTGLWLYSLYVLLAGFAVYRTFGLAINGRYLNFPSTQTAIAVAGIVGLILIRYMVEQKGSLKSMGLNSLIGHEDENFKQDRLLAYVMLFIGVALVIGETYSFMVARDLIADYPGVIERLGRSLIFTVTNGQLMGWLACLIVLSLPLFMNGCDDSRKKQDDVML